MRKPAFVTAGSLILSLAVVNATAAAQTPTQQAQPVAAKIVATPATLNMKTGDTTSLKIEVLDADGKPIEGGFTRLTGPRTALNINNRSGKVTALAAGKYEIVAATQGANGQPLTLTIPVNVSYSAVSNLQLITVDSGKLYVGVTLAHNLKAFTKDSFERHDYKATWTSSNNAVASVDKWGNVTGKTPGRATITADADGAKVSKTYTVSANPVKTIDIAMKEEVIRTGDVVRLAANMKAADGRLVNDAPITWSYTYVPDDSIAPQGLKGGPGIVQYGRFAANYAGRYTILAQSGAAFGRKVVQVQPRESRRKISVVGRGTLDYVHTSDLWPWHGADGRDYCLVGTWGGDGWGMVFDITDLNNIRKTDSVKVDARTINDVTVSPNAKYAVLSREGASNRVNGVVILDISTPAHPKIASTFDQNLTGGVHNVFATDDYLFAVSGGSKYVIIDMKDITKPKYVSEYEHPGARLHDLWVNDGIAYSAQGGAGTVVVDVGNGKYGGTIQKPKLVTVYPVNSGHEIFPYFQKSTGKVYLFIGDEEMNRAGRVYEGTNYQLSGPGGVPPKGGVPQTSGGFTHIIDFTDPMHPIPVGRYHLEDYGSHDIIVQDDILYQAYYDGGVRLVDVSGELMGNLVDQQREIAVFKPFDPTGYTPNAPFVMNAMPWKKDFVLFTDFNSGLWAAKIEPKQKPVP
jgi:hypothetical protein